MSIQAKSAKMATYFPHSLRMPLCKVILHLPSSKDEDHFFVPLNLGLASYDLCFATGKLVNIMHRL